MPSPKDDIITLPNPHLKIRSKKIGLVDDGVKKIIQQMKDALLDWEASREHEVGVALAAIQIDKPVRVVIVRDSYEKDNESFTIFINPAITKTEGEIVSDFEGCLSVKDIYGKVPRYSKVKVKALDIDGKEFRVTAEGFLARVLQHEIDHTNGMVFVDRIKDQKDVFFKLTNEGNLESLDEDNLEKLGILR